MLAVQVLQQRRHQVLQVFQVVPQRRHANLHHVEPVIQVAAQLPPRHRLLRHLVGGRQHPHVHRNLRLAPQPPHPRVLQHPQQLGLRPDRHLPNLIQQQRAPVRQLEAPRPPLHRSRKRPLLVPENLALHQRLGNGRAVHRHKGLGPPRTQLMDGARRQLLPRAALPDDQHRGHRGRHLLDQRKHALHDLRAPHQVPQEPQVAQPPTRRFELPLALLALQAVAQLDLQALRV